MMSRAVGKMFALQPTTTSLVIVGLLFQLLLSAQLIPGRDCSSGGDGGGPELAVASSSSSSASSSSSGSSDGGGASFSPPQLSHASAPKIMRTRSSGGGGGDGYRADLFNRGHSAEAAALLGTGGGGGGSAGEKPKLIPLVASDSGYSENSSVNILCTVSQGHHETLTFDWFKDGQSLSSLAASGGGHGGNIDEPQLQPPRIESQPDHSLLRVSRVKSHHAGRYTCSAKNQFGQDSSSVNLLVNVRLQWTREPPKEIVVSLNQELKVDCLAQGEPKPSMRWEKLDSPTMSQQQQQTTRLRPFSHSDSSSLASGGGIASAATSKNQLVATAGSSAAFGKQSVLVSSSRYLSIGRAKESDGGLYECIASNGHDADLRKLIYVQVRVVPARFNEKFSVVQAKSGESAKLECNATGDQPLTVNWFKEDAKLSKRGGDNFEIYETMSPTGINSVMVIRSVNRADGLTYKCIGENEYGNDERLIKLMVVEVPSRPMNVRVKEAWSRSASIVWSTPFAGNSPITSYIVQYWRKNTNEAGQGSQNHRRQEFTVSATANSALITNLMPALTYEVSVIAENQVGRSEPSENIAINTGEDEPSAAPSDVSVEARGPSTIRVAWKVPPSETWNGKLLGFYIGYRPRSAPNSIDHQMTGAGTGAFSYRTVDFVKGQQVFETFLTNLMRGHEYEVVVKTFNTIGSGPDSHLMTVRTFDGDLPAPPSLFAHQSTHSSISLRWTYPSRAQSAASSIKRYILYYQRQGDESWLEVGIPVEDKLRSSGLQDGTQSGVSVSESGTTSYLLSGLDSGFVYKIYVVAVNNFGMGDPSNIVTTKTDQISGVNENLRSASHSSDFNVFEMNRQFQLFLVVPIVCTVIMVVVIVLAVLYCGRRMPNQPAQHVVTSQCNPQTMQSNGSWGPEGTIQVGQRYVEFDKGGILKNNGLLVGTQGSDQNSSGQQQGNGGHFQMPYGTMPMNSVVISDQKSWDRQSSAPLKPLVTHIYDSPI